MSGNLNYVEIPAEDSERAQGFWSSLFGWQFNAYSGDFPYVMTQTEGGQGIGLYRSDDLGLWAYFYVDDLDEHVRRVEELGGRVRDRGPVAGVGHYARCEDTEGNKFGLFQVDESAQAPAE